jgi:hypothetical protein
VNPPSPIAPEKSGLATGSLVCGILSPFTCLATALPAIIVGHISLSQIKSSGGTKSGSKSAIWGLSLGYGSFVLVPVIAAVAGLMAPLVLKKVNQGKLVAYSANVRQISVALTQYQAEHGTDTAPYPSDIRQLDSMGITTNIDTLLTVSKQNPGDWLYFSAADSENPDAPLLVSPPVGNPAQPASLDYVFLNVGGAVRIVEPYVVEEALKNATVPPEKIPAPVR